MLSDGEVIGAYVVRSKIGSGGMGTVYLGEHALLGRKAAIKVLNPSVTNDLEMIQRFFNEARAVTQVADPGIVQVFDYGHHTDGSAFIVMELLDGEALDKRIDGHGRMEMSAALALMRMTCTALAKAHAKGIVHRDLKPENIFIVPDPAVPGGERAKVLDFGIAKLSRDDSAVSTLRTQTGYVMGSPIYMSPEQCKSSGDVDHRSDIYSFGCVMFSMLTGRPPFNEQSAGELIAAHLREPAPLAATFAPDIPPEVDQILQRCLAKAPGDRFQSMLEIVAAIDDVIGPPARPSTPAQRRTAPAPVSVKSATVTTMSRASGEIEAVKPPARGWLVIVVVVGAVMGAGVVLLLRGGGEESPAAPPPAAAKPAPMTAVAPPDAATADAPTPIDAEAAPPIDAFMPPIDAAAPPIKPHAPLPHVVRQPENSNAHHSTGSGSAIHVDRGD